MKKIHMDVDSARGVIAQLEGKKGELEGFVTDVSIAVNGWKAGIG